jgi:hypothetical protein
VVSTDLQALHEYSDVAHFAHNSDAFIEAVERTLAGDCANLELRLSAAREQTYEARTRKMLALIQKTVTYEP